MKGVVITSDVLKGYLNCKYLAHMRLGGDEGTKTDYENLLLRDRFEQRLAAAAKIQALYNKHIVSTDIALSRDKLREGASFILNAQLYDDPLHIHFDGLKKVDGSSELGAFHYVPILLSGTRKVRKNDRLLLEILGLIASRIQGREPRRGVVYHGPTCLATSVGFSAGLTQGKAALHELKQMQQGTAVPKLLLNDHCRICEFRSRCHAQAVEEDNLTLLRGIGEKDLKRYARRGLFTLTQISHTFRPRRRGKRSPPLRVRDHALHALAIRDKTVYVFGTPDVPSSVSEIYLDIEGKPDGQFVYLIGIVICAQDRQERYSFWADTREEERIIFDQLIAELSKHPDAKIFCYGAYERTFLKRMRETARRKKVVDLILNSLVNVLSLVYAHFYFPTYSNGLKDIGALLGCSVWRAHWEKSRDESWKTKLIEYNLEDCDALHKLVKFLRTTCKELSNSTEHLPMENHSGLAHYARQRPGKGQLHCSVATICPARPRICE